MCSTGLYSRSAVYVGSERDERLQVDTQAFFSNFKLARRVAVRQKAESHDEVEDRLSAEFG